MFKYFVYALSIFIITACGDGYAGGPEDTPPEHLAEIPLETDEGNTGTGVPYFKKAGKGDIVFKARLKRGVNLMGFNYYATYKADREKEATLIIMKDGVEQIRVHRVSLEEKDSKKLYGFMVLKTDGVHTLTVYVPSVNDEWELAFMEKSSLSPDILELAPNPRIVTKNANTSEHYDFSYEKLERYILNSDELKLDEI